MSILLFFWLAVEVSGQSVAASQPLPVPSVAEQRQRAAEQNIAHESH